jgi:dihydrofolate reductase
MCCWAGASVVQQYLAAGLVDEFWLHVVPVLLGAGARLLEHVGDLQVEQVRAIEAPGVTHIKYRVVKSVACAGGQLARRVVVVPAVQSALLLRLCEHA